MNRKFTLVVLGVLAITTVLIIVLPASDKIASLAIDPHSCKVASDCGLDLAGYTYFYGDREIGGCECINSEIVKSLSLAETKEVVDCVPLECKCVKNVCITHLVN